MTIAIILAALTAISTLAGGALALKAKNRLHLVLGLSAGLLLGLVAFDLLPEVFELGTQEFLHAPIVSIALIAGFLLLHFYERILVHMSQLALNTVTTTSTHITSLVLLVQLQWVAMCFSMAWHLALPSKSALT